MRELGAQFSLGDQCCSLQPASQATKPVLRCRPEDGAEGHGVAPDNRETLTLREWSAQNEEVVTHHTDLVLSAKPILVVELPGLIGPTHQPFHAAEPNPPDGLWLLDDR